MPAWPMRAHRSDARRRRSLTPDSESDARMQAAKLIGFVGARFRTIGSGRDLQSQKEYDSILSLIREGIGREMMETLS